MARHKSWWVIDWVGSVGLTVRDGDTVASSKTYKVHTMFEMQEKNGPRYIECFLDPEAAENLAESLKHYAKEVRELNELRSATFYTMR